jgi:hypothetical protein
MKNPTRARLSEAFDDLTGRPDASLQSSVIAGLHRRVSAAEPDVSPVARWLAVPIAIVLVVALAAGLVIWSKRSPLSVGTTTGAAPVSPLSVGTTTGEAPVHVSLNSDRFVFTTPAQMCGALLVADGTVSSYSHDQWNTANGTRPPGLVAVALVQQGYAIVTPVKFSALTIDRDHRTKATSQYVVIGGTVGQDSWADNAFPRPSVGSRVLMVFVPSHVPGGTFTQESLVVYDAFPIDTADMVTLRPQTIEQGQVSQTEAKVPLSEILKELAQCP